MVCSYLMLVFDMIQLPMALAYSKMGKVMALNIETIRSFCLPHLVEVSALRMNSVHLALVMVMFMCCENVCFGLIVIPKIFGVLF